MVGSTVARLVLGSTPKLLYIFYECLGLYKQGSRNRGGWGGGGGATGPSNFCEGGPGPPNIYQELQ